MIATSVREELDELRRYFESGETLEYKFRLAQLKKLRDAIRIHEQEIADALYSDLRKSPEESYATETGLLLTELNLAIKKLHSWMQPVSTAADLPNFPSSAKLYRDPLGVVLIIAPWNYPLQLLLIPLVGAIAGGNCAVVKPSEHAPATSNLVKKIITETFPSKYVKVVTGDGSIIIPGMMDDFRFDHVFYTGSIGVGKSIYQHAAEKLIPVTLELGGKSPAIVDKDASIRIAAKRIVLGKFLNVGQTCIAPDYLLVHRSQKDELIQLMIDTIKKFYTDDPSTCNDYGKIIHERRFDTLVGYLDDGEVLFGGKHDRNKLYISPTIIDNVSMDSPLMRDEIFGPLLPVISYETTEEAIEIIRQNPNPLAFYLFTNNRQTKEEFIKRVPFGGGCINNTVWHFANYHLPFGGVGNSGIGAYHGKYTFDTFTRLKPLLETPTWFDPAIKYPPFKGRLGLFKRLFR
jgi:aldehyde dehydrogenase (NAD+)